MRQLAASYIVLMGPSLAHLRDMSTDSARAVSNWRRKKQKRLAQRQRLTMQAASSDKAALDMEQLDTFHRAIRPFLCLAKAFGLMPLVNVRSSDPLTVKFSYGSLGMLCSLILLIVGSLKAADVANQLIKVGLTTKNLVGLMFFGTCLIICLNFISLARCWSLIIVPWSQVDLLLLYAPYAPYASMQQCSLRQKLRQFGCCFSLLALVEHVLYYVSNYYNFRMKKLQCQGNGTEASFSLFMAQEFPDVHQVMPEAIFIAWAFLCKGAFAFVWNFMDLFIMLVSLGLAWRLQQFAARVSKLTERHVPDDLWYEIRQHHVRLCELVELVDAHLSSIILISCVNNVYFICNQLLNIFTKLRYLINYVYFWYSLCFLVGRCASVFRCGSKIHDAAMAPLRALYMLPSQHWTEEVQRFLQQLTSEFIGLSGHRLFFLTRQSFFILATTLVTYEFMLLQFDAQAHIKGLPDLCA